MRFPIIAIILLFSCTLSAQDLTPTTLLQKSIEYHDPNQQWATFDGTLRLTEEKTSRENRERKVEIDNKKGTFYYWQKVDNDIAESWLEKDSCHFQLNGKKDLSTAEITDHRLNCNHTKILRNYYSYIYGLPMKLQDEGTILGDKVLETTFDKQEVYGLKVTYDPTVGKDIWYFYFDKKDYHLVGYRFYHDEEKNDGEYIHLAEEAIINGVKMPRVRTWYTHQEDKLLGIDILLPQ